jgi:KDO2-lipid IV(A) lauroyltransferase
MPSLLWRGGLRAATAVTRGIGPLRYAAADSFAIGLWALQGERRRRTASNHQRADPAIDAHEARRRARRSFREYVRTNVDFIWANGMDLDDVRRHAVVRGEEHIDAARAGGGGGILALAHFGSWDMGANIARAHGVELTTVMAPIGSPTFTELVLWARERNHLEVYPPENAARGLLRALRKGRFVALLCDIPGGGPSVVVDFCGGPVSFSSVPAWLALRTGSALIPIECWRGARHTYQIDVHPRLVPEPGEDEAAVTQRLATVLERAIRRQPGQWYPFGHVYVGDGDAP